MAAGVSTLGHSWGASWGDFNGNFHSFFAQTTGVVGMDLPLFLTHALRCPGRVYYMPGESSLIDATSALGFMPAVSTGV